MDTHPPRPGPGSPSFPESERTRSQGPEDKGAPGSQRAENKARDPSIPRHCRFSEILKDSTQIVVGLIAYAFHMPRAPLIHRWYFQSGCGLRLEVI